MLFYALVVPKKSQFCTFSILLIILRNCHTSLHWLNTSRMGTTNNFNPIWSLRNTWISHNYLNECLFDDVIRCIFEIKWEFAINIEVTWLLQSVCGTFLFGINDNFSKAISSSFWNLGISCLISINTNLPKISIYGHHEQQQNKNAATICLHLEFCIVKEVGYHQQH